MTTPGFSAAVSEYRSPAQYQSTHGPGQSQSNAWLPTPRMPPSPLAGFSPCPPGIAYCGPPCTWNPFSGWICRGFCTDLKSDPSNCGGCFDHCLPGQRCVGGTCLCPPGEGVCAGACTNLQTSANCGSCGNACPPGTFCHGGQCLKNVGTRCPAGSQRCPICYPITVNGVPGEFCVPPPPFGPCTDLSSDPSNCGSCGKACGPNQTCQNGNCTCPAYQIECPTGSGDCIPCDGGSCSSGTCVCPSGTTNCNGICTSVGTAQNCTGTCDRCGQGQDCCQGQCVTPLPDFRGFHWCGSPTASNAGTSLECPCPPGFFCGSVVQPGIQTYDWYCQPS